MLENTKELAKQIKQNNGKRILLQVPEGLKTKAVDIMAALRKEGIDAMLSGNACYGACDIRDNEALVHGCDLVVHIGHSKFYRNFSTAVPVLYYNWPIDIDFENIDFSPIKEKRLGLVTTIQHITLLDELKARLEKAGKEVHIGGQVLGCWTMNAEKIASSVDAFLYVGSGRFHPLAIKNKKVYALDIEKKIVETVDTMHIEKRRYANIYNANNAKTFAILVTTKAGQNELLGRAEKIKEVIEQNGRNAFIFIMDEINDNNLMGIKADAFINTACPRIAEDSFSKPIVNANDVEEIFK